MLVEMATQHALHNGISLSELAEALRGTEREVKALQ